MTNNAPSRRSAVETVEAQLIAYNARDIDAFMNTFAGDAQGFELGDPTPSMPSRAAIQQRYRSLFENSPKLNSIAQNRIVMGNTVIDHEFITGRNGVDTPFEIVVIYEVVDGLIQRFHATTGAA